ncbi:MAG: peroxiredoxin [Hyphomicrobiaceae bacterium]|jgi:peroxiredoxin
MSRRTLISLIVPLVLIAAYFGVTSYVRAHVTDLIQHAVDKPLPDFQLVDRAGKQWSKKDLAGKRAVLHFFRSHCHSCDVEAPAIRELEKGKPDDVVWLHVMTDVVLDVTPATTDATIARKEFTEPILMADVPFVELFHKAKWAQVTPITYVIDKNGIVRYGLRGRQEAATVRQAIAAVGG